MENVGVSKDYPKTSYSWYYLLPKETYTTVTLAWVFYRSLANMPTTSRRRHTFIMASLIKFSLMIVAVPKLELAILVAVVFIGFTGWSLKRKGKGFLDLSVMAKPINAHLKDGSQPERKGGRMVTCSIHISGLTRQFPVEMKAVSTRQPYVSQQSKPLEPGVLAFSQTTLSSLSVSGEH